MTVLSELLGESDAIQAVNAEIEQVLGTDGRRRRMPPILIEGETGTGKGLLSRLLHAKSSRCDGPFVEINCAAIPAQLLEAELFGYERGSFTDARQAKPGLFESANHGTLFLDEIALLAKDLQGKVLTVVESGLVRRIGSTRSEPVDIWIIAASNEDLPTAVREHRFREDLYHRLAVLTLKLPPLRARGQDAVVLAQHFLERACAEYEIAPKRLAPETAERLLAYPWPGNVRELRNVVERTALLSRGSLIMPDELRLPREAILSPAALAADAPSADDPELSLLTRTLQETSWNFSRTAAVLGISRNTLRHRIAKYGLVAPASLPFRRGARSDRRKATHLLGDAAVPKTDLPEAGDTHYTHRNVAFLRVVGASTACDPAELASLGEKVAMYGGQVEERGASGLLATFGLAAGDSPVLRAAFAAIAMVSRSMPESAAARSCASTIRALLIARDCPIAWAEDGPQLDMDAKFAAWQTLSGMIPAAVDGAILVHESAIPFLERRLELRLVREGADAVHELTGQPAGPFRQAGVVAPFVGREHELTLLRSAYEGTLRGTGRAITIVGEPGIGKSRLLFEFRGSLRQEGACVVDVRCHAHATRMPYVVVVDILRQLLGMSDGMDRAVAIEHVRDTLHDIGLLRADTHLYELLGLQDRPAAPVLYNAEPRIVQIVREIVRRSSGRHALVLFIDDLHWMDKASERCLTAVAAMLDRTPLLLVTTQRPGARPPWAGAPYSAEIALPPLSQAEARELLTSLTPRALATDSATRILETAEGNAFFLEELLRALPDGPEGGAAAPLPRTVQEAVLGRIDLLNRTARHVLHAHAVFGRSVTVRLLTAVCCVSDVTSAIEDLVREQFLLEDLQADEPTYRFKHALTQQVIYENLPVAERAAIHAKVGGALERIFAGELEEVADALAHHYVLAGIAEKALAYVTLLADRASRRHDHAAALEAIADAFRLVTSAFASSDDRDRITVELAVRRAHSLHFLGGFVEIQQMLLEYRPALHRLCDATLEAEFMFLLARNYGMLGRSEDAIAAAGEAIRAAQGGDDRPMLGRAYYVLGLEYSWLGRCVESIAHAQRAAEIFHDVGDHAWEGQAHWVLGFSHGLLGEIDAALGSEAHARAIARSIADVRLESYADWTTGFIYAGIGRTAEAIEYCERALRTAVDPHNVPIARGFLGHAYLECGDTRRAIELLEHAVRETRASGFARFFASVCGWLAEAMLLEGKREQAYKLASEALEAAQRSGHIVGVGWAQRVLGMVAYAHGELAEAERCLQEALKAFSSIAAPVESARVFLAVAEVATARGDAEAAARYLSDARAALIVPTLDPYRDGIWGAAGPGWSRAMRALRGAP